MTILWFRRRAAALAATANDGWGRPNDTRSPTPGVGSRKKREAGRARDRGCGGGADPTASWGGIGLSLPADALSAADLTAAAVLGHG